MINEDGTKFVESSKKTIIASNKEYFLKEFFSSDLIYGKHPDASASAYIDYFDNKLFLISATGKLAYTNIDSLNKNQFIMKKVKSNINEIINYEEFYSSSRFGIKDMLIYNDRIYLSYTNQKKKGCFNTSILTGNIDLNKINFSNFFVPNDCVERQNIYGEFNAHQSGGRMFGYENKIIFSTGEFRYRTLAQNPDNIFGKILQIDIKNKDNKILSIGHRNPQGLFYNYKQNILLSSEHGPYGGDEINILDLNEKFKIPNFGWPQSSYGNHYYQKKNDPRLTSAPLYKSHKKYGFIEPIKYFTHSIGISQIINIPKKFNNSNNENQYLVGSLGDGSRLNKGALSLFYFVLNDKNNKIIESNFIKIRSRVRDIIYIKKINKVLMYLESSNSIGILELKNN